jgi:hypothetical protein
MANYSTNFGKSLTEGPMDVTRVTYRGLLSTGPTPTLFRGVVIDVITDPNTLTEADIQRLALNVDNPDLLTLMTPNTIIAKVVSSRTSETSWTSVFFPFWSSHIMTPIAPGEQVYIIYEDVSGGGKQVGFWMTRVHAYNTIEDVNYTHLDRRFDPTINRLNYTTSEETERPTDTVSEAFQNGGNTVSTATLPYGSDATINPYDVIFEQASATKYITPEPVPRWKKRPQELVLQGANNSLIMLGEDRNGPISGALSATPIDIVSASNKAPRQAGAIDIVVGRGRYFLDVGEDPRGGDTTTNPAGPNSTAPLINDNSRFYLETDKNPYRSSRENIANPFEGDPSPIYDAARIYVVQQSRVDENYLLVPSVSGLDYPAGAIPNEQPPENGTIGRSYVVAKADHLRFIARREPQLDTSSENIAGTILIVREGAKNTYTPTDDKNPDADPDGNLAYIYFNKEGKIQIDANRIYLGQATGEKQAFIRYEAYANTIEVLRQEIDDLRSFVKDLASVVEFGFTSATDSLGVPIAKLTAALGLIGTVGTGRTAPPGSVQPRTKDQYTPDIDKAKSKKVFGE